jgi:TetR/AcrR family transcriptional regulator, lmrAB and yxaGH operons repressor
MPGLGRDRSDALPALAEVFREHGFDGASLARITQATELGKGSLYNFFPGGKEEMAAAVLENIARWFEANIFAPLQAEDPDRAIQLMMRNVDTYFRAGQRVCLVGAFALSDTRDRFAVAIKAYFQGWINALSSALARAGMETGTAARQAEEAVLAIQGALILTRALHDETVFTRATERITAGLMTREKAP